MTMIDEVYEVNPRPKEVIHKYPLPDNRFEQPGPTVEYLIDVLTENFGKDDHVCAVISESGDFSIQVVLKEGKHTNG